MPSKIALDVGSKLILFRLTVNHFQIVNNQLGTQNKFPTGDLNCPRSPNVPM